MLFYFLFFRKKNENYKNIYTSTKSLHFQKQRFRWKTLTKTLSKKYKFSLLFIVSQIYQKRKIKPLASKKKKASRAHFRKLDKTVVPDAIANEMSEKKISKIKSLFIERFDEVMKKLTIYRRNQKKRKKKREKKLHLTRPRYNYIYKRDTWPKRKPPLDQRYQSRTKKRHGPLDV